MRHTLSVAARAVLPRYARLGEPCRVQVVVAYGSGGNEAHTGVSQQGLVAAGSGAHHKGVGVGHVGCGDGGAGQVAHGAQVFGHAPQVGDGLVDHEFQICHERE